MLSRNFFTIVAASFLALLMASPANARRPRPPEIFKVQGDSQSLASVVFPLKESFQNEVKMPLHITGELSAVKGLEELDKGISDALVVAMSFEELNRLVAEAGLRQRNKALTQHFVLMDEISYRIIVNPANPVTKLSDRELRKIFSGSYKNWDNLDGNKTPLKVVWGEWSTGASWVLADRIMDGEPLLKNIVTAQSSSEIAAKVAADPDAIGIVPLSALTPEVKTLSTSDLKIEGPIILVTVGFPMPKHFQLMKMIKGAGRSMIGY